MVAKNEERASHTSLVRDLPGAGVTRIQMFSTGSVYLCVHTGVGSRLHVILISVQSCLPACSLFFYLFFFFSFLLVCIISDSEVITCSASSAIKRQVHSPLINAQACTPAISSHERLEGSD